MSKESDRARLMNEFKRKPRVRLIVNRSICRYCCVRFCFVIWLLVTALMMGVSLSDNDYEAGSPTVVAYPDYNLNPFINQTQFHEEGYTIAENVFPSEEIDAIRANVLRLRKSEGMHFQLPWFVPSMFDPGVTIPNFMQRPNFQFMHHLVTSPSLITALRGIYRDRPFRYCSHNDIGIDRIVGWHKDRLNNQYRHYQQLPLWENSNGTHMIVKTLIYLQDHTDDDDALLLVPGSYLDPIDPNLDAAHRGAIRLHPKKGDVVIFEQRATHRGREYMLQDMFRSRSPRILVSLGFGANNAFTDEFEAGTMKRQIDQCGEKCQI